MYSKGELDAALDSLEKGYSNKRISADYYTNPYFVGSIYYKQGKKEEAIQMFKKIDSTYKKDQVLYPELTSVYKTLANYYRETEDREQQLQYLNDLIHVDSLVSENNLLKIKPSKSTISHSY